MNETLVSRVPIAVDVGAMLDDGTWSMRAKALVFLAAMSVILDGFDNQVLGFALPAIIKDWHVNRSAFAPVVAIGLIGMTLGAAFGGMIGDRVGRKTMLVTSLLVFGLATGAIASIHDVPMLSLLRFVAGAGIGGSLPNASALTAEFSPGRRRASTVTLTIVCVPLGGMIGGLIAAAVLPTAGWRFLFVLGGIAPLLMAVVMLIAMPESPRYLARRPQRAPELERLLRRLGHVVPPDATFSDRAEQDRPVQKGVRSLLSPFYRRDTFALWGAFFFCLFAVYSVFSWAPTLLTGAGLSMAAASNAVGAYNFGGVVGALFCAAFIGWIGSRALLIPLAALAVLSALGLWFISVAGAGGGLDTTALIALLVLHGLCVNAVQTSLYALAAHVYLTDVRASGLGSALGIGRIGAIISSFTGAATLAYHPNNFYLLLALAMAGNGVCLLLVARHIPAWDRTKRNAA
jgi:AAHS family 4-hydroxybenzoate transporter-like MFS transporter